MRLEFSHTPDDWVEAARAREPGRGPYRDLRERRRTVRREWTAWTLFVLGCTLVAPAGAYLGVHGRQALWFIPTIFAVALAWLVVRQVWTRRSPASLRKQYAANERNADPITFEIDDAGLHQVTPSSEHHVEWTTIRSFFETATLLIFIDDTPLKFFLPKRAFASDAARDAFCNAARDYIAAAHAATGDVPPA